MGRKFRVRDIDSQLEKDIVTSLIVYERFCQELFSIIDYEYFRNTYTKKVALWCMEYYEKYDKAPGQNIEQIFNREKKNLDENDIGIIESLLLELSDDYEEDKAFNLDYVLDKTIAFFKERSLRIKAESVLELLDSKHVMEAESEMLGFKEIARTTSSWINPLEFKHVSSTIYGASNPLYTFPGALGKLIGTVQPGWFLTFMGPRKRGKSFNMIDFAVDMAASGLNVVVFSLEMTEQDMNLRVYQRMTAFGKKAGEYVLPCFDCLKNQMGECDDSHASKNKLTEEDDEGEQVFPEYSKDLDYTPCTYCRGKSFDNDYEPAIWYESFTKEEMGVSNIWNKMKSFKTYFGDRLRVRCLPKFSANVKKLEHELDLLEVTEGFVPNIVIVDYADILAAEDPREQGRDRIDTTWKTMAQKAGERKNVWITAMQTNRPSDKKLFIEQEDASEDIRKLAHVDVGISINQTRKEKRKGAMRLGITAHRHLDYDEEVNALMLQQLSLGQVHLDSMLVRVLNNRYVYLGD